MDTENILDIFYRLRESRFISVADSLVFPKIVKTYLNKDTFIIHSDESAKCFNTTVCIVRDQVDFKEEILCDDAVIADDDDHHLEVDLPNEMNYTSICGNLTFYTNIYRKGIKANERKKGS